MSRVELIAETSSNAGGDIVLAKEFIHAFAEAGADWVKFQTTRVAHLNPNDPQYAWFKQAELSEDAHYELKAECEKAGTKFLTTVYHAAEVPMLAKLGLEAIKIGSGEAHERALLMAVREVIPRVLVSTGLSCGDDLTETEWYKFQWLWAVSRYPTMPWMYPQRTNGRVLFNYKWVGWSDHAIGIELCQRAIFDGATVIEKHVQLPHQARPPKAYEATVQEFKELRQYADEDPTRFIGRWQHA